MRNIGTFMHIRKNFLILQGLKIDMWVSQTTFTSFYLENVTHRHMGTFSMGPVEASQQVV